MVPYPKVPDFHLQHVEGIIYNDDNSKQYNFMYKEQILCFDGRIPHMVDTSNLNGDHFAIVLWMNQRLILI